MAKFWKSLSILKNHFKISGKYFEKSLLPNCPDWKENSTMIKKSYVPFYQSLIFLFLLAFVASVSKNTCISTRKQQQLGENKNIRLWSTGNSYFKSNLIILHINRSIYRFRSFEEKYLFTWVFIDKYFPILFLTVKFCDKKYL